MRCRAPIKLREIPTPDGSITSVPEYTAKPNATYIAFEKDTCIVLVDTEEVLRRFHYAHVLFAPIKEG